VNFHSQGLHGLLGHAPPGDRSTAPAPLAFRPAGDEDSPTGDDSPARRRIPAHDIIVIGRSALPPIEQARPVRTVPRISRRRLAVRIILVTALIGESILAVKTWPSTPIPVPDASSPRSMIA